VLCFFFNELNRYREYSTTECKKNQRCIAAFGARIEARALLFA